MAADDSAGIRICRIHCAYPDCSRGNLAHLAAFGDQLPPVDPIRIVGGVILFLGALTLIHASLMAFEPKGVVLVNPALTNPAAPDYTPDLVWQKAVACPPVSTEQELVGQGWVQQWVLLSSLNVATCGWGGGFIGYILQNTLANAIGTLPVFVIAIVAVVSGLMVTNSNDAQTGRTTDWAWV